MEVSTCRVVISGTCVLSEQGNMNDLVLNVLCVAVGDDDGVELEWFPGYLKTNSYTAAIKKCDKLHYSRVE